MTTATRGAGAVAPPPAPSAPAIRWNATQARVCQVSACGRFAVRETTDGGLFFGIDHGDLTRQSPVFRTVAGAREWCAAQVARGTDVNGDEWAADELPRF